MGVGEPCFFSWGFDMDEGEEGIRSKIVDLIEFGKVGTVRP